MIHRFFSEVKRRTVNAKAGQLVAKSLELAGTHRVCIEGLNLEKFMAIP
jgi:hypothetical protein